MDKIFIIGFAGAGKSTVGKRLSLRLGWKFFDTDSYIEQKYHLSVSDFFQKYGEEAFRICEQYTLSELMKEHRAVIATGGGAPCFFRNMEQMLDNGHVVYLKLSPQSLFHRLRQSHKERPLVAGKSDEQLLAYVEQTLLEREKYYNRAHLTVKGENFSMNVLLENLERCGFEGA